VGLANWTLYSKKIKIDGDTERERSINYLVDGINDSFANVPSYFEVYINGSETATGVQIVEISESTNQSNYNAKTIIMKPEDALNIGDLIYWNSEYWLCLVCSVVGNIYYTGKILKCTNTLQHYKNNVLLYQPIVIESGIRLYSMGQDENKYISTVNDEIIAYIPNNSDTQEIKVDQIYMIGRRNYEIKSIQDIIIPGLLVLKMKATTKIPVVETHDYSVVILNGEEVTLYGGDVSTLQLNIQCKLDNNIVTDPIVEYTSSNENTCEVSETGLITITGTGSSTVTVSYGSATDTIKIVALMSVDDNFEIIITPSDTNIYVNETKLFTASVANNGVTMPFYSVTWDLINSDNSSNVYCTYVVDERNITITAKNTINKSIKIKAILDADNEVYTEKMITVRSVF
jgi:hypothetical protein